jgi:hypothetical protein
MKGLHITRHVRQHGAVAAETCSSRTRPRVARQSRVEVKHPFAPRGDWIVRLNELERARRIRPLKDAEHGVVGIARLGAAEKLLRSEGQPKRRKNFGAKWTDQLLTTSPLIRKTSRLVARTWILGPALRIISAIRAAWSYPQAWPEVARITNLVSFEPDEIDVYLDDMKLVAAPGQNVVPHGIDRGLDPDEMLERGAPAVR